MNRAVLAPTIFYVIGGAVLLGWFVFCGWMTYRVLRHVFG